jgi:hypothetical protein
MVQSFNDWKNKSPVTTTTAPTGIRTFNDWKQKQPTPAPKRPSLVSNVFNAVKKVVPKIPEYINKGVIGGATGLAGGIVSTVISPLVFGVSRARGRSVSQSFEDVWGNIKGTATAGYKMGEQAVPGSVGMVGEAVKTGYAVGRGYKGVVTNNTADMQYLYNRTKEKLKQYTEMGTQVTNQAPPTDQELDTMLQSKAGLATAAGAITFDLYILGTTAKSVKSSVYDKNYKLVNKKEILPGQEFIKPDGTTDYAPLRFAPKGFSRNPKFNESKYYNIDGFVGETGPKPVNILKATPTDKGSYILEYFQYKRPFAAVKTYPDLKFVPDKTPLLDTFVKTSENVPQKPAITETKATPPVEIAPQRPETSIDTMIAQRDGMIQELGNYQAGTEQSVALQTAVGHLTSAIEKASKRVTIPATIETPTATKIPGETDQQRVDRIFATNPLEPKTTETTVKPKIEAKTPVTQEDTIQTLDDVGRLLGGVNRQELVTNPIKREGAWELMYQKVSNKLPDDKTRSQFKNLTDVEQVGTIETLVNDWKASAVKGQKSLAPYEPFDIIKKARENAAYNRQLKFKPVSLVEEVNKSDRQMQGLANKAARELNGKLTSNPDQYLNNYLVNNKINVPSEKFGGLLSHFKRAITQPKAELYKPIPTQPAPKPTQPMVGQRKLLSKQPEKTQPEKVSTIPAPQESTMPQLEKDIEEVGQKHGWEVRQVEAVKKGLRRMNPKYSKDIRKITAATQQMIGEARLEKGTSQALWDSYNRILYFYPPSIRSQSPETIFFHEATHIGVERLPVEDRKFIMEKWNSLSLAEKYQAFGSEKRYKDYLATYGDNFSHKEVPALMASEYIAIEAERIKNGESVVTKDSRFIQIIKKILEWLKKFFSKKGPQGTKDIYDKIFNQTSKALTTAERPPPAKYYSINETVAFKDKFGLPFVKENIPVKALVSDPNYQPRVTESAKATEESVYKLGYKEGLVTQPLVVNKVGNQYIVLGGHSRTHGLLRREAEGLSNPELIQANVYENLSDQNAKQISRAANQQTQEESLLDKAKSINESLSEGVTPQVSAANKKRGFTFEDYGKLWDLVKADPTKNLKAFIENGLIDEGNALNIAQKANTLRLDIKDVLGVLQAIEKQGKGLSYERFNQASKILSLARDKAGAQTAQTSLFGDTQATTNLSEVLNKIEVEKSRLKNIANTVKKMQKIQKEDPNLPVSDEWLHLKAQAEAAIVKIEKNEVDSLVKRWSGEPMTNNQYVNKVIEIGNKETAVLEKNNTTNDDVIVEEIDDIQQEANKVQIAFGRQESQVDLSQVDAMLADIPKDAPPERVTELVSQALARKRELMAAGGFNWSDSRWIKSGKGQPTVEPPSGTANIDQRYDWGAVNKQVTGLPTDVEQTLDEMDKQIEDGAAILDKAADKIGFGQKINGILGKFLTPGFRLPTVWREVLIPMENFTSFVQAKGIEVRKIMKSGNIKPHSDADYRIKRFLDGTPTEEDKQAITPEEKKVVDLFHDFTNQLFNLQMVEIPKIIDRITKITQDLYEEMRVEPDNQGIGKQILQNEEIVNWLKARVLTPERYVKFYMPRYRMANYSDVQPIIKRIRNYFFKSLESRTDLANAVDPNASVVDLLDRYVRGASNVLFKTEMFVKATRAAEKLAGNHLIEAREYLDYLKTPRNIAAWNVLLTRAFNTGVFGIRTQLKNLTYGAAMGFGEFGKYWLKGTQVFLSQPRLAKQLLQGQNFLQDVQQLYLGTVGATGLEKASQKWSNIQSNLPSNYLQKKAEITLRSITYLAAHFQGLDRGLTGEALDFHRQNGIAKTQFNYSFYDVAPFFRSKFGRPAGQFVATRIRVIEQLADAAAKKDWKKVLRFFIAASLGMYGMSQLWGSRKKITAKVDKYINPTEYTQGGIDWLEGVDVFDIRKLFMVKPADNIMQNIWNYGTAALNSFIAPMIQIVMHSANMRTGLDTVYNAGDNYTELMLGDLKNFMPQGGMYNDVMYLLEKSGIIGPQDNMSTITTIVEADNLIDAEKDPKKKADLQKKYPLYIYASLARSYQGKIDNLYSQATKDKSKAKKKAKSDTGARSDAYGAINKQLQKDKATLLDEFLKKLEDKMKSDGTVSLMNNLIGVPTANAMEVDHEDRVLREGTSPVLPMAGNYIDTIKNAFNTSFNPFDKRKPAEDNTIIPGLETLPFVSVRGQAKTQPQQQPKPVYTTATRTLSSANAFSVLKDKPIPTTPPELAPVIQNASTTHGVPANVLSAVLEQETHWNANNYSKVLPSGTGIAQFTKPAIDELNRLGYDFTREDALDPQKSIDAAAFYLNVLKNRFGSWWLAVKNYNGNNERNSSGKKIKDIYVQEVWSRMQQ